jgi:AcrR family transcriptional regulator
MVTKSKTTERRHKLRLELIEAAEAAVAANGMKSLTARDLAKQVGCSVGAIYNVFEDIDELVIAVNSRTLARLDRSIAAFEPSSGMDAQQCLVALAQAYCRFAIANTNLWTALFEHGERINRDIPDWHLDEHVQLIRHIVKSLETALPHPLAGRALAAGGADVLRGSRRGIVRPAGLFLRRASRCAGKPGFAAGQRRAGGVAPPISERPGGCIPGRHQTDVVCAKFTFSKASALSPACRH